MKGTNIGDELNAAGPLVGLVRGRLPADRRATRRARGDRPQRPADEHVHPRRVHERRLPARSCPHSTNQGLCDAVHPVGVALGGTGQCGYKDDYIPHHEPFQFYASTANPHHLTIPTDAQRPGHARRPAGDRHDTQTLRERRRRSSTRPTTSTTRATSTSSWRRSAAHRAAAVGAAGGQLPQGARLRGRPRRPTRTRPTSRQFVTDEINALEQTPDWRSTAVIINYDDSDGWYDHVYSGVTNPSLSPADNLTNTTLARLATNVRPVRCRPADLGAARRRAGPLRLRATAADAGDLAVRAAQLRRPQPERPGLDHQLHRVQLAPARGSPARPTRCSRTPTRQRHPVRPGRHVRLRALHEPGRAARPVDGSGEVTPRS